MRVLVDTPIWSVAFRRTGAASAHASQLHKLIATGRAQIIGAIRQEVLSGIRDMTQWQKLRARLQAFPDLVTISGDYEEAAAMFNACRWHGIQRSGTDFLLCAIAIRHRMELFTTDNDFVGYAQHIPIRLHVPATR